MHNRLISFVHKRNVLIEAQNGFRKMKSTDTASQTFIAGIQKAMELHLHVVGILLALTKAYDVLNHNT
jgi:hypothetical protein